MITEGLVSAKPCLDPWMWKLSVQVPVTLGEMGAFTVSTLQTGNQGTEGLSRWARVPQLVNGRVGIWSQRAWIQSPWHWPLSYIVWWTSSPKCLWIDSGWEEARIPSGSGFHSRPDEWIPVQKLDPTSTLVYSSYIVIGEKWEIREREGTWSRSCSS